MSYVYEGGPIETRPTLLFPLYNYDANGRDPGGCPVRPLGFITNQNRMALPTWSYAMEKYPPQRIVEIGAYNGGFTCALAIHAWNIGATVHSFDVSEIPDPKYAALGSFLGITWHRTNCFSEEGLIRIRELIQWPGRVYLLCDGGNKAREINTFAEFLKPGDIIGGHDYHVNRHDYWGWSELREEQVRDSLADCEPFMQEHFDVAAWLVYRRK